MTTLFEYPRKAAFGRTLHKNKIYKHASPNIAVKELFVRQVERITWQFKLAPETINIKGTQAVTEIQIFSIDLKEGALKTEVLRCIDRAIPSPILFELHFDDRVKPSATYKRPNEADSAKWVISEYFGGEWVSNDTSRKHLPMVLDLESLYAHLLAPLMPYPTLPGEGLQAQVGRMEQIRSKQREQKRCKARLRKEKQFNQKVTINAELRGLKQELENLTRPLPASGSEATT